jgi:hypothetical protein
LKDYFVGYTENGLPMYDFKKLESLLNWLFVLQDSRTVISITFEILTMSADEKDKGPVMEGWFTMTPYELLAILDGYSITI